MIAIDGQHLADTIKNQLATQIRKNDLRPGLAIILVGNDPGSEVYVRLKKKAAEYIGMDFHLYTFPEDAPAKDIEQTIDWLNADDDIDGILIQLPLPLHLNENVLIGKIDPKKDADGFHPENIKRFLHADKDAQPPGLTEGILLLIDEAESDLTGKHAAVLANSSVFALPITESLERRGATVKTYLKPKAQELTHLKEADLVVVAVGKKNFVSAEHTKFDAIIIDVGYNREEEGITGDVDFNSFRDTDARITPVPGGVGPMTVAILLKRVYELFLKRHGKL